MTPKQFTSELIRGMVVSLIAVVGLFAMIAATGPYVRAFAEVMGGGW